MKKKMLGCAVTLLAGSLIAADSTPKEDVIAAARKLGEQASYSWKQTVVVPEDAPFKPSPSEGKTVKGGVTYFTFSFGDNSTQIYLKGTNSAVSDPDGGWQSASELEGDEGPGRFMSFLVRDFKTPAAQAGELAGTAKELKSDEGVISGEMTTDAARSQFKFGTVIDPKGSVKFSGSRMDKSPSTNSRSSVRRNSTAMKWMWIATQPLRSPTSAQPKLKCRRMRKRNLILRPPRLRLQPRNEAERKIAGFELASKHRHAKGLGELVGTRLIPPFAAQESFQTAGGPPPAALAPVKRCQNFATPFRRRTAGTDDRSRYARRMILS